MDKYLKVYIEDVERYLKRIDVSERIDILNELKSYIEELKINDGLTTDEIISRLGSPKDLASGYLSKTINGDESFSLNKLWLVFSFYSLTSLSGMFVLPFFGIMSGGLILSSGITVLAAILKLITYLVGFDIPYITLFSFGSYSLPTLIAVPFALVFAAIFYLLGKASWRLVIKYINKVSDVKQKIGI